MPKSVLKEFEIIHKIAKKDNISKRSQRNEK